MKKSLYSAVVSVALLASTASHARDFVIAPAQNWSGFYVGGHAGNARGDHEVLVFPSKFDGAFGGLQIGYWSHFAPQWLYGFEADISFADVNGANALGPVTVQVDRFGTARTRIGYATGPWLLFASGGLAWAKVSADSPGNFTSTQAFTGWAVGIGAEYAIAPRWSLKAEYLYADFGRNTELISFLGAIPQDLTFSTFRVGLNYRLGAPAATQPGHRVRPANYNWSGGYIGVHGGFANGEQSMTYLGGTVPFKPDGGFAGFQGGYNWQFASNVVLGLESDISFADIKGHFTGTCCTVKIEQLGTVRLRAGYAMNNVLFYATGGLAWSKNENDYLFSLFTTDRPFIGWTGGVGVEYAFSPLWSVKAEYLRVKFDDNRSFVAGLTPFDERAEYDLYRLGLNYRVSLFELIAGR